ncbi:hypothetical protein [Pseudanabaena sp. UWO310]|uniref:hypothetical protein n=1 Tax=Pseudanabaena sp. UWO310 TaxID=2480795 RepID=UPI00115BAE62|nr:hypothetical protein [Pseudanabaena sp. UWO310]TYQ28534.1 hypothetical protein PseudUWO310_13880 [Pseudanabaena sp. UWO310]
MKEVRLTDLDELALKVRDRTARSYILEAIDAYRGGAYRSAIVSTWIAVTFDVISKIRELSNQGDPMAQDFINKLDQAIAAKQIRQLQNIEEDLLKTATIDFEFLSDQEQVDITRLKDDRNLCAHPAFVSEEMLFEPEPERVRMHIVHVVKHLLQHQPVQGKSAIARIVRDIKTTSFPPTLDAACIFLNSRYFDRAKRSLTENLLFLLLKAILRGDVPDLPLTYARQILLTLQAISNRHPDIYEERMKAKLLTIIESLDEGCLPNVFRLLGADPRCWNWLDESAKIHLKEVTQVSLNKPSIRNSVFEAILVNDLKPIIIEGFNELSSEIQISVIKATPQPEFATQAIALYSKASDYRGAERLGESLIFPMANCFSVANIQDILRVVEKNSQIYDATGTPAILEELFEKNKQYLPDLRESWKSLFVFLHSQYSWLYNKSEDSEVLKETGWENLANRLKAAGVNLSPE